MNIKKLKITNNTSLKRIIMGLNSSIRSFILLLAMLLTTVPLYAQFGEEGNINEALIRLVEPGQLADTVNVWGNVGETGRYLVPRDMTIAQLLSYAGGPENIGGNLRGAEAAFSKSRVKVTLSKYDAQNNREIAKYFSFRYSEKIPREFRTYNLSNEEVIIVEVERKPTFLDYLGVIGPILGTITTSYFIYDQIIR